MHTGRWEQVVETVTNEECEGLFAYLGSRIAPFRAEHVFARSHLTLLRTCNLLLKRLSKVWAPRSGPTNTRAPAPAWRRRCLQPRALRAAPLTARALLAVSQRASLRPHPAVPCKVPSPHRAQRRQPAGAS